MSLWTYSPPVRATRLILNFPDIKQGTSSKVTLTPEQIAFFTDNHQRQFNFTLETEGTLNNISIFHNFFVMGNLADPPPSKRTYISLIGGGIYAGVANTEWVVELILTTDASSKITSGEIQFLTVDAVTLTDINLTVDRSFANFIGE